MVGGISIIGGMGSGPFTMVLLSQAYGLDFVYSNRLSKLSTLLVSSINLYFLLFKRSFKNSSASALNLNFAVLVIP